MLYLYWDILVREQSQLFVLVNITNKNLLSPLTGNRNEQKHKKEDSSAYQNHNY